MSIAQSLLLVLCLGLLLFGSAGRVPISGSSNDQMAAPARTLNPTRNVDRPLLQQMLNRSQRILRRQSSKSVQSSGASERNGRDADARNMSDAEYVNVIGQDDSRAANDHRKFQHVLREDGSLDRLNVKQEDGERRESSSELGGSTYTPASMSVPSTSVSPVRRDSYSEKSRRQQEVDFYVDYSGGGDGDDDDDTGLALFQAAPRQNAQLRHLTGNDKEDGLLSPASLASPASPASPSPMLLLDEELRETQSGPPTPSGRRSIAH